MRRFFWILLLLCSIAAAQDKPYRILNSFNAGELTPLLSAREDLAKYQSGCSLIENLFPLPQGGAQKRPGTKYVATVKDANYATPLVSFEYSTEQSYIIELGNEYMRFYKDGGQIKYTDISFGADPSGDFAEGATMTGADSNTTAIVVAEVSTQVYTIKYEQGTWTDGEIISCGDANVDCAVGYPTTTASSTPVEISTDFSHSELYSIQFTQSADVLYFVHPNHPPQKLSRYSHDHWILEDIVFDRPPFLSENTTDITITPSTSATDVTSGETYSESTKWSVDHAAAYAFDDVSTGVNGWATADGEASDQWIKVDFGAGDEKTIVRVKLQPLRSIAWFHRGPKYWKLEGSPNDIDWTKIPASSWNAFCQVYDTNEVEGDDIGNYTNWMDVSFTNSTPYRYYRIWVHSNWGGDVVAVKEIEMFETAGNTYTANADLFTSDHVGSYWQITHTVEANVIEGSMDAVDACSADLEMQLGRNVRLITDGSWVGTIALQKSYDDGDTWKDVTTHTLKSNVGSNLDFSGEETEDDAIYRVIMLTITGATACDYTLTAESIDVDGVIKITSCTSPTTVTATTIHALGGTTATKYWAEGAWSDKRGYPRTTTFFQDRLFFGGNNYDPQTIWGSKTGDYYNMKAGAEDDDALKFTISSRQINSIQWLIGKGKLLIGTSGAEWTMSGSTDEPITPSNVKAEQQSIYGSASLQANLANESVLFFQRGARKMRELAYNWELDSYVAPDMTILAKEVTGDGITDSSFQQIPDSILWCIRDDGEIATFSYERKEMITSWSRQITDGDFESGAIIHGDPEDEVWVSVKRTIDGSDVRYIEYFSTRDFNSDVNDAFYVDCGISYDGSETNKVNGLDHLKGKTVAILADGEVHPSRSVLSDENCVAHWAMNDNAATATVADSVGSHNGTYKDGDGDVNTDTGSVTGKINGALDFDGDEYVEVADHNDFSFGDGTDDSPFGISAWIYMDDAADFPIVSKIATNNYEYALYVNTSKLQCFISKLDVSAYQGRKYNTALSTGQWYHIVMTYDGRGGATAHDGIKLYVDAAKKDDTDDNFGTYGAMDNGTAAVGIGRSEVYANGKIDNVMIFNKELSQAEISALYYSGNGTEDVGEITLDYSASKIHVGLPYTVQLKTMPLSWLAQGMTIQGRIKRINGIIPRWFESGDFYFGKDVDHKEIVSIDRMTTDETSHLKTFPPGYGRGGQVYIYQRSPEPLTLLSLAIEFQIY